MDPHMHAAGARFARALRGSVQKHAPDKRWLDLGTINSDGSLHIDGFDDTDVYRLGDYYIAGNLLVPFIQFSTTSSSLGTSTAGSPAHSHSIAMDAALEQPGANGTTSRVLVAWVQFNELDTGITPIVLCSVFRSRMA